MSRKPGVPSGLSEPHGLLLLLALIFFSLNTLFGRGRSTQGVKAWMPPLVSWLEFPARVMETGLEEGWSIWVTSGVAWTRGGLGEQPPARLFRGSLSSWGPSLGKGWPGDRCLGFTEGWSCVPTCLELSYWGQVWEPLLEGRRGALGSLHVAGPGEWAWPLRAPPLWPEVHLCRHTLCSRTPRRQSSPVHSVLQPTPSHPLLSSSQLRLTL